MRRRQYVVTGAALASLVGEWVGHNISYFHVAGLPGLQAGLSSWVHDYRSTQP